METPRKKNRTTIILVISLIAVGLVILLFIPFPTNNPASGSNNSNANNNPTSIINQITNPTTPTSGPPQYMKDALRIDSSQMPTPNSWTGLGSGGLVLDTGSIFELLSLPAPYYYVAMYHMLSPESLMTSNLGVTASQLKLQNQTTRVIWGYDDTNHGNLTFGVLFHSPSGWYFANNIYWNVIKPEAVIHRIIFGGFNS